MKIAASDDIHQILSPSIALTAHDGPVSIESCSDKGGLSVLASGPVRVESGSASLVMTGNGDRSAIRLDPGQGGNVLVFSANDENSTLLGLNAGQFDLSSGNAGQNAGFLLRPQEVSFRIGLPGVGSSILMTSDAISFKVGTVELSISNEGIVAKTPGAKFEVSQAGIAEQVGISNRQITPDGHLLKTAESSVVIDPIQVASQGLTVNNKGQMEVKNEATFVQAAASGILMAKGAMTNLC